MGEEPGQGWLLAAPLLPTQLTITNSSIISIVMHSSPGLAITSSHPPKLILPVVPTGNSPVPGLLCLRNFSR